MKLICEINSFTKPRRPLYLALGNFDGIHKGHQKLIKNLVNRARTNGGAAAAFIFEPHPSRVLNPRGAPGLLTTADIKAEILEQLGIDILIYTSFSAGISKCTPEQFVQEILIDKLSVKEVFVGFNYSFGFKGAGTPEMLTAYGEKYNFKVNIINSVKVDDIIVSSTLVREMLNSGNIGEVHKLLGYYPMLEGIVVEGERRGNTIGFPTANLSVGTEVQVPSKGVYAAFVSWGEEEHMAVVNIGNKPTFHDNHPVSIEVHILNFEQNIYDKKIRLHFIAKIRDEIKFAGIEELVKQIEKDRDTACKMLLECSSYPGNFTF